MDEGITTPNFRSLDSQWIYTHSILPGRAIACAYVYENNIKNGASPKSFGNYGTSLTVRTAFHDRAGKSISYDVIKIDSTRIDSEGKTNEEYNKEVDAL